MRNNNCVENKPVTFRYLSINVKILDLILKGTKYINKFQFVCNTGDEMENKEFV